MQLIDHPSVLVTGAGRGRTNLCSVRLVKSTAQMLCHTATLSCHVWNLWITISFLGSATGVLSVLYSQSAEER